MMNSRDYGIYSYPGIGTLCLVIECKVALGITTTHSGDLRMVYMRGWFLTPIRGIFLALLGMISVIRVA